MGEWFTYLATCNLKMACYEIVVDLKKQLTYLQICNLRMTCYDIVDDSKWTVNLFGDPKPQNGLLLHYSLF